MDVSPVLVAEKALLPDSQWRQVEALIREVGLMDVGLTAPEYTERIKQSIATHVADPEAVRKLHELARVKRQS